jgi:ribosomal-protein-serine acetyltransferase
LFFRANAHIFLRMFRHDLGGGASLVVLQRYHAPAFLEFIEQNRAYLAEWLDWTARVHTVEDAERFIQRGLDRFSQDGLPWVAIYQGDAMAGGILFFPIETRTRSTEIGYWLGQHAAGRGLMSRAIPPLLDFVFNDIGLNRVGLFADVRNMRSRAVAERLGFTFEGIKRDGWTHNDQFIDVAVYSLLARDWRSRPPPGVSFRTE